MPEFPIKITADTAQFGAAVKGVISKLNSTLVGELSSRLKGLFAFGAIVEQSRAVIRFASAFKNASQELRVGTDFLQEAAFAAEQTGQSFEQVEQALRRLRISQAAMQANPGGPQAEAGARMGLTATDTVEQAWVKIREHIKNGTGSAQEFRDVVTLMGRGADRLTNSFKEFDEIAKKTPKLDPETIEKLDQMGNTINRLMLQLKVTWGPALVTLFTALSRGLQAMAVFVQIAKGQSTVQNALDIAFPTAAGIKAGIGEPMNKLLDQWAKDDADFAAHMKALEDAINTPPGQGISPPAKAMNIEGVKPIGSDQFARIGAYLTAGTAGLAQTQIGLLRVANQKLDKIERAINNNTAIMENQE